VAEKWGAVTTGAPVPGGNGGEAFAHVGREIAVSEDVYSVSKVE